MAVVVVPPLLSAVVHSRHHRREARGTRRRERRADPTKFMLDGELRVCGFTPISTALSRDWRFRFPFSPFFARALSCTPPPIHLGAAMPSNSSEWPFVPCSTLVSYTTDEGDRECAQLLGHGRAQCVAPVYGSELDTNASSPLSKLSCACHGAFMNSGTGKTVIDPRLGCGLISPEGIVFVIAAVSTTVYGFCILCYGFQTLRLMRRRLKSRSCWARHDMALITIFNIIAVAIWTWWNFATFSFAIWKSKGPLYPLAVFKPTLPPLAIFQVLAISSVSVQWMNVASKAKALQKTTPAAARRRALVFVASVTVFTTMQVVVFVIVLNNIIVGTGLLALTAIALSVAYLVGANKLAILVAGRGPGTIRKRSLVSIRRITTHKRAPSSKEAKIGLILTTARRILLMAATFLIGIIIGTVTRIFRNQRLRPAYYSASQPKPWGLLVAADVGDLIYSLSIATFDLVILMYLRQALEGGSKRDSRVAPSAVSTNMSVVPGTTTATSSGLPLGSTRTGAEG